MKSSYKELLQKRNYFLFKHDLDIQWQTAILNKFFIQRFAKAKKKKKVASSLLSSRPPPPLEFPFSPYKTSAYQFLLCPTTRACLLPRRGSTVYYTGQVHWDGIDGYAEQRKSISPLHMNSRKAFSPLVIKILAYIPVKCHSFSYKYQWGVICISTTWIVNLQKDGRFSRTLRYTQECSHLLGRYPRLRSVIEIIFYFGNWTLWLGWFCLFVFRRSQFLNVCTRTINSILVSYFGNHDLDPAIITFFRETEK